MVKKISENHLTENGTANQRQQKIIEQFPALIWHAGTDAKCDYFNLTWLEFTGRTLEQELGDGWAEGVHPDDLPGCLTTYLDSFNARRPFAMEYRLRHHDGNYRWISDHGSPYCDLEGNFAGYIGSCYDISPQKAAEQSLRQAQAELEKVVAERTADLQKSHNLLESFSREIPGGLYQFQLFPDGHHCIPFASQSMLTLFEIELEEIRRDASGVMQARLPADVYPKVIASIHESARTMQPLYLEFQGIVPALGLRWLQCTARPQPQPDGSVIWHGFINDISERIQIKQQLEESQSQLKEAQRMAHIGSWSWDIATGCIKWSDELYAITGRDPRLPAITYDEQYLLYCPDSLEYLKNAVQRALTTGKPYELELEMIRADGMHRTTIARGESVLDQDGNIVGLQGTLQDITEQKQLEQQLFTARKLESIGQLAGGVAHEVRNPLNAILSVSEALFRETEIESNPVYEPYIQHIRTQVNRLAMLMDDLLDLGKPIPTSSLHPVFLDRFCSETIVFWNSSGIIRDHDVRLVTDPGARQQRVMIDYIKLQQVFCNLIENASQHSPKGSTITIRIAAPAPDSACSGMAVIRISDSGTGIPHNKLPRVFDPFYSDRKGGTGLGLTLVRHFIENMGGTVTLRNNDPPPGCCAELLIPLAGRDTP